MSDIFDEISEDLRAERAKRLLQRYGILLVALAVLVIAGVAAWQGWSAYRLRNSAQQSDAYLAAMRLADGGTGALPPGGAVLDAATRQKALEDFTRIAQTGSPGYRTLARLRAAALEANGGDLPGALTLWDQVSADTSADPLLRDLASLIWAMHQVDSGDEAAVAARLAPLAAPDNAWHTLAQEQQALLAIREGKNDAARETLRRLAQDATAPDGVRGRANGLLARLGDPAGS